EPERIFHNCCTTTMLPSTTAINCILLVQKYTWGFGFRRLCGRVKVVEQVVDHVAIAVSIFGCSPRPMLTSDLSYRGPREAIEHSHATMSTQGAVVTAYSVGTECILECAENGN